jgi:hypothetical protein
LLVELEHLKIKTTLIDEIKVSYRSMGTTGDPVPSGHRDGPDHHFTG